LYDILERTAMKSAAMLAAAILSIALPAGAQTPRAIGDFIDGYAATTARLGKIARWEYPICPLVVGLPPNFTKFITERVRKVATDAGAPVDDASGCKPNIEIAFTAKPQALMDGIRQKNPVYLGYYDTLDQAEQMAQVTQPIQAWYTTETRDLRGQPQVDSRNNQIGSASRTGNAQTSSGSRLGDELRSAFFHVMIVADPGKLGAYEMGAIADAIAMLALSQPASQDSCQKLPSIVNLATTGCGAAPPALTKNDSAYLTALYKINLGGSLRGQKDAIAFEMRNALAAP
jgi:hypothetical protein